MQALESDIAHERKLRVVAEEDVSVVQKALSELVALQVCACGLACNFGACVRHASPNGVAYSVLLQCFEIQIYLQSMTSVS